jgi:hypothetical protein
VEDPGGGRGDEGGLSWCLLSRHTMLAYVGISGENFTDILRMSFPFKTVLSRFSLITVGLIFCAKNIGTKDDCKMFVKLNLEANLDNMLLAFF